MLAEHASGLSRAFDRFDALVASVSTDGRPLVITHGEPHSGNLLRTGTRLLLLDWDTAGLAAQEAAGWLGSTRASVNRRWDLAVHALLGGLSAVHEQSG